MTDTLPTWFDDDLVEPDDLGLDHVVVRLGGGRYGIAARDVAEVVPVPVVTRVPGAPGWVRGVANWRGHVLPVVDLRPLLEVAAAPLPTSARLVVVAVDEVEVGVVAESVLGLLPVPETPIPPPAGLVGTASSLVSGLADPGPAGPVAVLGTAALLALGPGATRRG